MLIDGPRYPSPRSPPGCLLRQYSPTDIRDCLSHQRMSIHGGFKAHQLFIAIAEKIFDQQQLTNASWDRAEGYNGSTVLKSDSAEIIHQPWPWLRYNPMLLHITSQERQSPLSTAPDELNLDLSKAGSHSPSTQASIVLNYFCNGLISTTLRQTQAYCCTGYTMPNVLQQLLLVALSSMVFFYWSSSFLRWVHLNCLDNSRQPVADRRSATAAAAFTIISATVLACFVADRTAIFEKAAKEVEMTTFTWLTSIFFVVGLVTVRWTRDQIQSTTDCKTASSQDFVPLSRQQTEEWKGWMQLVILLYHYCGLSKVLWVYQFVRLLVASYLFMTGFGHTTYFLVTGDFSARRVMNVLLRSNLLNIILAFTLGTRYDLYYFPMLTSVWFIIIWVTLPRIPVPGNLRCYRRRIVLSAVSVLLMLQAGTFSQSSFGRLHNLGFGLLEIDGHEFLFRFGLDAYVVYAGMVTAILLALYRSSDILPANKSSPLTARLDYPRSRIVVSGAVMVIPAYALFCCAFEDKFYYNKWHPFISPLPVIAYVVVRNSTPRLSSYHSLLFAWLGRCSLETFVLQYHIWLAADSRGLLRLGLFNNTEVLVRSKSLLNLIETAIIFVVLVLVSHNCSKALTHFTKFLVALQPKFLIISTFGLWIFNLLWTLTPLGQHEYSYLE